jgi:hypothetical protein
MLPPARPLRLPLRLPTTATPAALLLLLLLLVSVISFFDVGGGGKKENKKLSKMFRVFKIPRKSCFL